MSENMYCSGQKGNSKEFDKHFDDMKWGADQQYKCPGCGEYMGEARGIGPICVNKDCPVIDGVDPSDGFWDEELKRSVRKNEEVDPKRKR